MVVYGDQACSVEKLFIQADEEMYEAKRRFKENVGLSA